MESIIRTIKKSQREEIRIGLSEYTKDGTTYDMVSARVYYDDGAEYRPGKNGLNIRLRLPCGNITTCPSLPSTFPAPVGKAWGGFYEKYQRTGFADCSGFPIYDWAPTAPWRSFRDTRGREDTLWPPVALYGAAEGGKGEA